MRPTLVPLLLGSLLLGLATVACQGVREGAHAPTTPVATTPEPPLPPGSIEPAYTAAEIAHSHPVGAFTTYRIVQADGPAVVQRTEWVESDAERCRMTATLRPEGGEVSEEVSSSAEWWELRNHGALPAVGTTVTRETIETPAGRFDCELYTYATEADGARRVARMWFDTASAGSPVRMTQEVDGATVLTMELLETNRRALGRD